MKREDLDSRTRNITEAVRIMVNQEKGESQDVTEVTQTSNAIDGPTFAFTWKMGNGNEYHIEVTGPPYPINWGEEA